MVGKTMNLVQSPAKKSKGFGLFDIVMAGLSGAIGFEIFVLLNYAYFHLAGPDMLIAKALDTEKNALRFNKPARRNNNNNNNQQQKENDA